MSFVTDMIAGATDSSGPSPTQYNTWQPANTNQIDTSFGNTVQSGMANANASTPYWQQYLSQLTTNPYQSGAQTASNNAGAAYAQVGNQALQNSAQMSAAGNQLYQTAMDPQQALYNRTYQQNQDQINANMAARGITNSGYGAGIANEGTNNFNIDWQNNQLARQVQGLQGMGSAYSNAGQLGTSGGQLINSSGAVPLDTYNQGVSTLGQGLTGYGSGVNAAQNAQLSPMLNYLGLGASQSNQQGEFNQQYWENQMSQTQLQNNLNNMMWGGLGQLGNMGATAGMGALGGWGGAGSGTIPGLSATGSSAGGVSMLSDGSSINWN